MRVRIVAWESNEGAESILDIVEIEGEPFNQRGALKAIYNQHIHRFLMDERVSRMQIERVKEAL